jgi:hypothetical protein
MKRKREQREEEGEEYEVEQVRRKKKGNDGRLWVLVKWVGYSKLTWVPFTNMHNALEKYEEFELKNLEKEKK